MSFPTKKRIVCGRVCIVIGAIVQRIYRLFAIKNKAHSGPHDCSTVLRVVQDKLLKCIISGLELIVRRKFETWILFY